MTDKEFKKEILALRELEKKVDKIIDSLLDYSRNNVGSEPSPHNPAITYISKDIRLKQSMLKLKGE